MNSSPFLSGISVGFALLATSLFLVIARPFSAGLLTCVEVTNRVMVVGLVGLTLYLVQEGYAMTEAASFQVGSVMSGLVVLFVLLNSLTLLVSSLSSLCKACRGMKK